MVDCHVDSSLCVPSEVIAGGGGASHTHHTMSPPTPCPAGPRGHLGKAPLQMVQTQENGPFVKVLDPGKALGKYSSDEQMIILMITESRPEQLIQFIVSVLSD